MLWNFASAGLLLWLSRRYKEEIKPGTIFAGWLVLAGIGRVIIEFFRPDQPKIPGLGISYSAIFAGLMAIAGIILLMARYKAIHLKFAENWEEEYKLGDQPNQDVKSIEPVEEKKTSRTREPLSPEAQAEAAKMRREKLIGRKTIEIKESTPPRKKSS
jgi:hypothetical protein